MSCGIGHIHSSVPALLWLQCGPAAATPIQPLAWEFPYATALQLRPLKKKKEREKERKKKKDAKTKKPITVVFE